MWKKVIHFVLLFHIFCSLFCVNVVSPFENQNQNRNYRDVGTDSDGTARLWVELPTVLEGNSYDRWRRSHEESTIGTPLSSKDVEKLNLTKIDRRAPSAYRQPVPKHDGLIQESHDDVAGCESIPVGGNAFELRDRPYESDAVKDDETTIGEYKIAVYFHMSKSQSLNLAVRCRSISESVQDLWVKVGNGETQMAKVIGSHMHSVIIPEEFHAYARHVKVELSANPRKVAVSHLLVCNKTEDNVLTFISPGFSYLFGRRGPSAHLSFDTGLVFEYCYQEIQADPNKTPYGTYLMAIGTEDAYFGIQSNNLEKRQVLFSVWGDVNLIAPEMTVLYAVPDSKVVNASESRHETTIYKELMWNLNKRHRFIMSVKEDDTKAGWKIITTWIAPEDEKFVKIGTIRIPANNGTMESIGMKGFFSFVRNLDPNFGHVSRKAYFLNQWCRTKQGKWMEITKAVHSTDETGESGKRMDHRGGIGSNSDFFLETGGFMNDYTSTPFILERKPSVPGHVHDVINELP